MAARTYALATAALAFMAVAGLAATKPVVKGPVTSPLNRPWPAPVQKKQPPISPRLVAGPGGENLPPGPGYQAQLVASEPLVKDPGHCRI